MNFAYPANIIEEDGFFSVIFRDLPHVSVKGKTVDDALKKAEGCLQDAITALMNDGLDIPKASDIQEDEYWIQMTALFFAQTAFYIAFRASGLKESQLAKKMDINEEEVSRMLSTGHKTRLNKLETALNILGYRLSVLLMDDDT